MVSLDDLNTFMTCGTHPSGLTWRQSQFRLFWPWLQVGPTCQHHFSSPSSSFLSLPFPQTPCVHPRATSAVLHCRRSPLPMPRSCLERESPSCPTTPATSYPPRVTLARSPLSGTTATNMHEPNLASTRLGSSSHMSSWGSFRSICNIYCSAMSKSISKFCPPLFFKEHIGLGINLNKPAIGNFTLFIFSKCLQFCPIICTAYN